MVLDLVYLPRTTPRTTDIKMNTRNLLVLSHCTTELTLGEFVTLETMVNVDSARCLSISSEKTKNNNKCKQTTVRTRTGRWCSRAVGGLTKVPTVVVAAVTRFTCTLFSSTLNARTSDRTRVSRSDV